jgi:hypothetical protein
MDATGRGGRIATRCGSTVALEITQVATYPVRASVIPTQEESPSPWHAPEEIPARRLVAMTEELNASQRNVQGSHLGETGTGGFVCRAVMSWR